MIEVNTNEYHFSHEHAPRGRGLWMFAFDGREEAPWAFNGSYAQAKKAALVEAAARGAREIKVMP